MLIRRILASAAIAAWSWTAAASGPEIVTDDIDRFWVAYDAVRATEDEAAQRELFERLYVRPGSPGLHAFQQAKGYTTQSYVAAIRAYPRFWDSIRPRTQRAKTALAGLQPLLDRFRTLYPALRPAGVYFEIGALRSGGTTLDDKVLIGAELATGDPDVDVSELPEKMRAWLRNYFASRPAEQLELLVVHEFVHTQERGERKSLLAQAIYEGAADFIAELVTGRMPALSYVAYGPAHDREIKAAFQRDMLQPTFGFWLYGGSDNQFGVGDLGYYVGYRICAASYARAADKQGAIKAMIELDFADEAAVQAFAASSGYFSAQ